MPNNQQQLTGADGKAPPPPPKTGAVAGVVVDPLAQADKKRLAAEEAKKQKLQATATEWLKVLTGASEDTKKEDVMSVLQVLADNDLTTRNKAKGLDVADSKDLVGFTTLSFPSR